MPAPTFVQEIETVWNNTNDKTTASFTVQVDDVLVVGSIGEGHAVTNAISNSGTAFTWTLRQEVNVTDYTRVWLWTTTATAAQSMTVTFDSNTTGYFGANVLQWRDSTGIGASAKTNVSSGAPTLNLTTTQANSAIVVANGDWNAGDGASRTWRTNAGTFTEQTYFRDSARYTVYGGYHADAGAVNTYAVGLSAPTGQKYSIVAVEVKGTAAGGAPAFPPNSLFLTGVGR